MVLVTMTNITSNKAKVKVSITRLMAAFLSGLPPPNLLRLIRVNYFLGHDNMPYNVSL